MPIFDPINGGCSPTEQPQPTKDSSKWGKKSIFSEEWVEGQKKLETKLHRKAASEMVEFISPGTQAKFSNREDSIYDQYHSSLNNPESFEGGDTWEENDIERANPITIVREALSRGRSKLKSLRTKITNRILRRVPFGESIKSALRWRS